MGSRCGYDKSISSKWLTSSGENIPLELKRFVKRWFAEAIKQADYTPEWYVKYAGIVFRYKNVWYDLLPSSINASGELFEHLARDMEEELVSLGAEDVFYTGMLD